MLREFAFADANVTIFIKADKMGFVRFVENEEKRGWF